MAERKAFLLGIDPAVLTTVQRWANDDLRSLNAQIEFLLRRAVAHAGRLKGRGRAPDNPSGDESTERTREAPFDLARPAPP